MVRPFLYTYIMTLKWSFTHADEKDNYHIGSLEIKWS